MLQLGIPIQLYLPLLLRGGAFQFIDQAFCGVGATCFCRENCYSSLPVSTFLWYYSLLRTEGQHAPYFIPLSSESEPHMVHDMTKMPRHFMESCWVAILPQRNQWEETRQSGLCESQSLQVQQLKIYKELLPTHPFFHQLWGTELVH